MKDEKTNISNNQDDKHIFTASTGVKFRLSAIPISVIASSEEKWEAKAPKPPVYEETPGSGVFTENRSNPEYIAEKAKWERQYQDHLMNLAIVFSTKVLYVPETLEPESSDVWINSLLYFSKRNNLEIPEDITSDPLTRHIWWLKVVAISDPADYLTFIERVSDFTGTDESEVGK